MDMEIKNLLNDFEYDWASFSANQNGFPEKELRGKSILISGGHDDFARSVLFAVLSSNDIRKTGISVSYLAHSDNIESINKEISGRDDVKCFAFGTAAEELPRADIVIDTGVCNMVIEQSPEFFISAVQNAVYTLECAEKTGAQHYILFSDYRACGKTERGDVVSEDEAGEVLYSQSGSCAAVILQTLEAYAAAYAKRCGFDFTILRCAIALGADAGFDDGVIYRLLRNVAFGSGCTLKNSNKKYSFVYISDILNAMFYACARLKRNTVYNVVGKDSTVTVGTLAAILTDIFPEKAKIRLISGAEDRIGGAAMSGKKLADSGCKPLITLDMALQLAVCSLIGDLDYFTFEDCRGKKLTAVHKVLLLSLLELDRVCRKNKIRYFLTGELLLGAVTNKGFLPWSTKSVVMLQRDDYNRFIEAADELPKNMRLESSDVDALSGVAFARIYIDGISTGNGAQDGVFLDVISQEKTSNRKNARWLHVNLLRYFRRRYAVLKSRAGKTRNPFRRLYLRIAASERRRLIHKYENRDDARFLCDGLDKNTRLGYFPRKWLKSAVYWDFEGYRFPIPKEYDRYLKFLYGNDYADAVPAVQRTPETDYDSYDLGKYMKISLPEHPYHSISVSHPVEDSLDLPKIYPSRSDAGLAFKFNSPKPEESVYKNDAAEKAEASKDGAASEEKTGNNVSKDGKSLQSQGKTKPEKQDDSSKPKPDTEISATIEFSLGETTDISKFSDSEELKKIADTREFELPLK